MHALTKTLRPAAKPVPERKRRRAWLLALLLLLLGYGGYRMARADPRLAEYRGLRQELFSEEGKNLPAEERAAKFQALRDLGKNLSPEARQQLTAEGQKRFEDELRRYHALAPQEKVRYLDERINRMEQARQNRPPNANGGPPGANAGGPGRGDRGASLSAEEREKRRKQRLDSTTPEFRALRDQFFRDMQARRQQRGLPVTTGFGR